MTGKPLMAKPAGKENVHFVSGVRRASGPAQKDEFEIEVLWNSIDQGIEIQRLKNHLNADVFQIFLNDHSAFLAAIVSCIGVHDERNGMYLQHRPECHRPDP